MKSAHFSLSKGLNFLEMQPKYYPGWRDLKSKILLSFILSIITIMNMYGQSCDCKEYIYLNEPDIGSVLKFEVGSSIPLSEVPGANGYHWYPGSGASELPAPHGIATDLNGFLYIAEAGSPSPIRKFNCDGEIFPVSGTTINDIDNSYNMFSIDNTLYVTKSGGINVYDLCTGTRIGRVNLCNEGGGSNFGNIWGLSYNPITETVYITERNLSTTRSERVWVFSRSVLEANTVSPSTTTCSIEPLLTVGPDTILDPGDMYLPNEGTIFGIAGDNSGNFYVVKQRVGASDRNYVMKFDADGKFIAKTPVQMQGDPYGTAAGVVWSEYTNRLYVSNYTDQLTTDCISAFDASTMQYLGTAAPNPGLAVNNRSKAIGIIKECCPANIPTPFVKNMCGDLNEKYYLNREAFRECDGIVCGSDWEPTGPITGMTFNDCDNSVTIDQIDACGTFTLILNDVISTGCPGDTVQFTICNTLVNTPTVSATCNDNGTPNTLGDDYIDFTVNVTGTNVGTSYSVLASGHVVTELSSPNTYGQTESFRLEAGSAGGGDISISIIDNSDGMCSAEATVIDPGICSTCLPQNYSICDDGSDNIILYAETGLTNYQWYNEAGPLVGETSSSLTVTLSTPGMEDDNETFYYTAIGVDGCQTELCCPINVAAITCGTYDVALYKVESSTGPYMPGSTVSFDINVINQGAFAVYDVMVNDYVPTGLLYTNLASTGLSVQGNAFVVSGAGPNYTIDQLASGDTAVVTLNFTIDPSFAGTSLINNAEIVSALDGPGGSVIVDEDSPLTNTNDGTTNELTTDNDVDDDSTGGSDNPTDEDDYDPAQINVTQTFDLALRKTVFSPGPFAPGDNVTYNVEVFNQGTLDATNIVVADYVPAGMIFNAGDNTDFVDNAGSIEATIAALGSGQSHVLTLILQIDPNYMGSSLVNNAEIVSGENALSLIDEDDDLANTNDGSTNELATDDNIDDDGPGTPGTQDLAGDEDDYDPAEIMVTQIFDLALMKQVNTTLSPGPYLVGEDVTFTITIINQGTLDATNIQVTDYIPSGMALNDPLWQNTGGKATLLTPIASLAAQTQTTVDITFTIMASAQGSAVRNWAEISAATNALGLDDVDSTPDDINFNQPGETDDLFDDDVVNQDGTNGGDEDDHDPAEIQVCPFPNCKEIEVIKN